MRIYTKCPCCGKIIFLVMEMELGGNFGLTYRQEKSQDWECLDRFLNCLQNSQGEKVYLGVNEREEGKIPEEYQELILNWTEKGYQKEEEKPKKGNNSSSSGGNSSFRPNYHDGRDWFNIHEDFHSQLEATRKKTRGESLKEQWIKAGFSYKEVKDWIDIGLKPYEFDFATWLRDTKRLTSEQVLNYGELEELRKEYQDSLPVNWD